MIVFVSSDEPPVEIKKGHGGEIRVKAKASKKAGNSAPKKKRFLAELANTQAKALALIGRKKDAKK